jgi:hypothetical protein
MGLFDPPSMAELAQFFEDSGAARIKSSPAFLE